VELIQSTCINLKCLNILFQLEISKTGKKGSEVPRTMGLNRFSAKMMRDLRYTSTKKKGADLKQERQKSQMHNQKQFLWTFPKDKI
jgi:2-methylaconitate cis-trans-isomerase PrpF